MIDKVIHVVDDDAAVRDAVGMLLSAEGYRVREYESAAAFLRQIGSRDEGCVITDVRMPEMNGIELIAKLT